MAEPAVLLVDSKHRDLAGAALIARHLAARGIDCHLEPLEAFKAVVGAHRPGIVVFNHLTASHLVSWSKRLASMNILTGVLPNEGITYDDEARQYDANRRHKGAHIDHFFCWNEKHREALISEGFGERTQFHVVGVPRFDFYFEPWSQLFEIERQHQKPRILICTNFPTARFKTLPREHADALFRGWLSIPRYKDYWAGIEEHYQARERFFDFVDQLVQQDRYEIIVRPHPVEGPEFYEQKIAEKPSRSAIKLDIGTNITGAIIAADLVIQCETCTTALESWIRKKPTISLVFGRNRLWYYEQQAKACLECEDPDDLPSMVVESLSRPVPSNLVAAREEHLKVWCSSPSGNSAKKVADAIADALEQKNPADLASLAFSDRRRGWRLHAANAIGEAYHYDPALSLKRILLPRSYAMRAHSYDKSIKPSDVSETRGKVDALREARLVHFRGGHDSADLDDPMSATNYRIRGSGPYNLGVEPQSHSSSEDLSR